jgi:hypothetical protein
VHQTCKATVLLPSKALFIYELGNPNDPVMDADIEA